ncbi:MAG: cell division protein FtsA [Acetobacteraceae bacterium]|nr:cell division protein FtsA [Acetobacteraceae bacterium]
MGRRNLILGVDVGTTKVAAVVGEPLEDGRTSVVGVGTSASRGIRKGVVVDIEATVRAVAEAVEKAERMAGARIRSAYVAIAGSHLGSTNNRGVVAVAREDREITAQDVERVMEAARVVSIPPDREIVHVIPRQFVVDGNDGIRDPVGMLGVRLEVEAHIVTGSITSIQNLLRSVYRAGLEVEEVVVSSLASAEAVLLPAEKDLGAVVMDLGGGTCDLAVFSGGSLFFTSTLPVGGEHITGDVAVGLRTPIPQAEKIKVERGLARAELASEAAMVDIPSLAGQEPRQVSERVLAEIIYPRVQEIFSLVGREIKRSGFPGLIPGGVVVTGGAAQLRGLTDVGAAELGLPVRLGVPEEVCGLDDIVGNPAFSTGVGLLRYAARARGEAAAGGRTSGARSALSRLAAWLKEMI